MQRFDSFKPIPRIWTSLTNGWPKRVALDKHDAAQDELRAPLPCARIGVHQRYVVTAALYAQIHKQSTTMSNLPSQEEERRQVVLVLYVCMDA